jgi:hypothetical protein
MIFFLDLTIALYFLDLANSADAVHLRRGQGMTMINLLFLIGFDNGKLFLLLSREMAMIAVDPMFDLTPIQFTCL